MELASFLPLVSLGLMHRTFSITTTEVALKYGIFNLFCSLLFLLGMYLHYFLLGTLDFYYLEFYISYCSTYGNPDVFFQFLLTLSVLLMLSPFFFKLGFFPFNGILADIYKAMPFSLFSVYATFFNFGAFLTFLYLLVGPFFYYLPWLVYPLFVVFVLTTITSLVGCLHSDFYLRPTIGFLSSGSISLILIIFLSTVEISEISLFDSLSHLIGGVFFYTIGLYLFLISLEFVSRGYARAKFKNFSDFVSLRYHFPGFSFLVFLLSGLPPTAIFFFKLAVFKTMLSFTVLFFVIFFQIVFLCVYVRLLTTFFTDSLLLEKTQLSYID